MTISDIAKLANVSKATVSRVLNNSGYVQADTRERVEQVIQKNQYTPSATAINLSRQTTKSISVIIPEIANSFFGELMQGISDVAQKNDYVLTYCNTDNNLELEEQAINMVQKQQTCGIIITPAKGCFHEKIATKLRAMYEKSTIPIVVVDRGYESSEWDGVFYENFQSSYVATKELISNKYSTIGIITGDMKLHIARERLNGYYAAMDEFSHAIKECNILYGDFTISTAYELTKKMFDSDCCPEAMVTCNNYTTLGFLKACKEYNVEIGRDIALIGIDHIPALADIDFPLSVVTRDAVQMGKTAMELLIGRLENPDAPKNISMIPCELRLKGSEKLTGVPVIHRDITY